MPGRWRVLASVAALVVASSCSALPVGSGSPSPGAPSPRTASSSPVAASMEIGSTPAPLVTWPVLPEPLPGAMPGSAEMLTCGGMTFPRSALDGPIGAIRAAGPAYDALRATLTAFAGSFAGAAAWPWRLVAEDAAGATFLARTDALGPPGWVSVEVSRGVDGWKPRTIGQCRLSVAIAPGYGPASWALDPAYPVPGPSATELHVLVWEQACSGGSPATGRIGPPVIDYGATTVTVTLGVRPLGGVQTCPGPRGTPATIRLSEPLGSRMLLDGGQVPAATPSPMF